MRCYIENRIAMGWQLRDMPGASRLRLRGIVEVALVVGIKPAQLGWNDAGMNFNEEP
jgi:hypothetical protein